MIISQQLISLGIALFAILNPIGNAAIYVGMTSKLSNTEKHKTAIVCALCVALILVITTWIGLGLLKFFGISIGAFQVAGGMIVTTIGLSMLKGHPHSHSAHKSYKTQATERSSLAVVPLAIPIIAGPGAMTTLISHMTTLNTIHDKFTISTLCCILSAIIGLTLYCAPMIAKLIGEEGMNIVTRLMGLVLTSIAIQMLGSGLLQLFPGLGA